LNHLASYPQACPESLPALMLGSFMPAWGNDQDLEIGYFARGDHVDATMRSWMVGARVFTAFGALALILAAVGLYSVIAYNVTQRRHELGVRLALGAGQSRVVRLIVMQGVRVAAAGVLLGSAIALVAGRWIGPLLFDVAPTDTRVFGIVIVTMLIVAAAASVIPAARAARLDPRNALQSE